MISSPNNMEPYNDSGAELVTVTFEAQHSIYECGAYPFDLTTYIYRSEFERDSLPGVEEEGSPVTGYNGIKHTTAYVYVKKAMHAEFFDNQTPTYNNRYLTFGCTESDDILYDNNIFKTVNKLIFLDYYSSFIH